MGLADRPPVQAANKMKGSNVVDKKEFQPYVPADKVMP